MKPPFRDHLDAGRRLAAGLGAYATSPPPLVLGLPRGGVPIAQAVARALGAPLDVLVVRRLGVPCREELALGAIAPGGVCVLNDELIDALDVEVDTITALRRREEGELERSEALYRGDRPFPDVRGRTVIVVDDSIATGARMHAAILFLHRREAGHVVVAAPVIARKAFRDLSSVAAEVVAVLVPDDLANASHWFEVFSVPTDEEVRRRVGLGEGQPVSP